MPYLLLVFLQLNRQSKWISSKCDNSIFFFLIEGQVYFIKLNKEARTPSMLDIKGRLGFLEE